MTPTQIARMATEAAIATADAHGPRHHVSVRMALTFIIESSEEDTEFLTGADYELFAAVYRAVKDRLAE